MAKKHLTDLGIERTKRPTTGRTEISDSEPGLFLWITTKGLRSWLAAYRVAANGKRLPRKKMTIGRWPAMSVDKARERAREIMALAAEGIDPALREAEEREAAEREKAEAEAGTFRAVAESYVAAMKAGQLVGGKKRPVTQTTAGARERLLEKRVLPSLGDLALTDVTPFRVSRLLSEIERGGGPVDETLKAIRGVFNFAQSRGLFAGPLPTAGMTNRQPQKKFKRALSDDELRDIWAAAVAMGGSFGSIIRMAMLTGQRKGEIAGLRWSEVDFERKLLVLPAERVKNRKGTHEVALSEPALEILRAAEAVRDATANKSGLVFPSDTGETPISGWEPLKRVLDRRRRGDAAGLTAEDHRAIRAGGALRADTKARKAAALEKLKGATVRRWCIHDLRHTFITRCRDGDESEEGEIVWSAPLDVLQATVNHEITAGVTAIYDHGDISRRYRLRKRELMQWWARKLMVIVGEAEPETNVIPLALSA